MLIEIKRWDTGGIIYSGDHKTFRAAAEEAALKGISFFRANFFRKNLPYADLRGADLRETNFYGVNLRGADLLGADLRGASFDKRLPICCDSPIVITAFSYLVVASCGMIKIGRQVHSVSGWKSLGRNTFIDGDEFEVWRNHKNIILGRVEG